jgi:hypothetical protein
MEDKKDTAIGREVKFLCFENIYALPIPEYSGNTQNP